MQDSVLIHVNGKRREVPAGITVSAALLNAGLSISRRSVTGMPRGPLCGMGICFECRVTIDGQSHQKGCQVLCREGMQIRTNG